MKCVSRPNKISSFVIQGTPGRKSWKLFPTCGKAWANLPADSTSIERVAAINAYLFQYLVRKERSGDTRAVDILRGRGAVCGGMVLTMAEMLYAAGYKSKYAYLVGGKAAHSMLEVAYPNGMKHLFDPYHGVLYFHPGTQRPVSLQGIETYIQSKKSPAMYAQRGNFLSPTVVQPIASLAKGYTSTPHRLLGGYSFPGIFTQARASGVANSGVATTIDIGLTPGQTIGATTWVPTPREPNPWTRLSLWRDTPTTYLSWAYVLGNSSLGYKVQHELKMTRLRSGTNYTLEYFVVNAYPGNTDTTELSMRLEGKNGNSTTLLETSVSKKGYGRDGNVTPQVITFSFTATGNQMNFRLSGTGDFVMMGIRLN